jgi:hypothetical protein
VRNAFQGRPLAALGRPRSGRRREVQVVLVASGLADARTSQADLVELGYRG